MIFREYLQRTQTIYPDLVVVSGNYLPKGEWLLWSGCIYIKVQKKLMRVFVHMFCFLNYIPPKWYFVKGFWQEVWPRMGLFVFRKTALNTHTGTNTRTAFLSISWLKMNENIYYHIQDQDSGINFGNIRCLSKLINMT